MPSEDPDLVSVREALQALSGGEVLVYGSYVSGHRTPRSDIDVAVITRVRDRAENRATWRELLGRVPDVYDVRVFELLPLDVQHDIAEHHEVLFGDPVEISYYLYRRVYRVWDDVGPRIEANQFDSLAERMRLMGQA